MHIATGVVTFTCVEQCFCVDDDTWLLLPDYSGLGFIFEPVVPEIVPKIQDAVGATKWATVCAIAFGTGFRARCLVGISAVGAAGVMLRTCSLTIRLADIILVLALFTR